MPMTFGRWLEAWSDNGRATFLDYDSVLTTVRQAKGDAVIIWTTSQPLR